MLLDLLRKRRSIRQYEERPVEQEKVDLIIEAMLRSPSSRGRNPWEFVVVTEKKKIEELAGCKPHGASFLKNAPLAIVVCAEAERCDVWVEDCSIATLLIHLAAADLDLGSCWVQIRKREHDDQRSAEQYVRQCLGLPEHLSVEAIVAIGYAKEHKEGHDRSSLPDNKVHLNTIA